MEGESLLHRSRGSGRDYAGWTNHSLVEVLHPSSVQSSRSIQHMQTVLLPKQIIYTLRFNLQIQVKRKENNLQNLNERKKSKKNLDVGPVFASQIKKLRKRFCWVDQPLSRSVLTPISCTKLKIHSAHAGSPNS